MFGFRKYVSWRQTSGTTAAQIWQLLAQLQQRHAATMARACTYAWACTVLLGLSGALLLAQRGAAAQAATMVRWGAATGLLGCLAMALYAIGLPLLWRRQAPARIPSGLHKRLNTAQRDLGQDCADALLLAHAHTGAAQSLAEANLQQVLLRLRAHTQKERGKIVAWNYLWPIGLCCALLLTASLALPLGRARLWAQLRQTLLVEQSRTPLVRDLEILLQPPAYTQQPKTPPPYSTGELSALPGTTAHLHAWLTRPMLWAEVWLLPPAPQDTSETTAQPIIPNASQAQRYAVQLSAAGELDVQLPLLQPGRWAFVFGDAPNHGLQDGPGHRIAIVSDAPPTATLLLPADAAVLPPEDALHVAWQATDDWGIDRVQLCCQTDAAQPVCQALPVPKPTPADADVDADRAQLGTGVRLSGQADVPMQALQLSHNAPAALWLQVTDNDNVTGPHVAISARHKVRLFAPEQQHRLCLQHARDAVDAMVDWLAAQYAPPGGVQAATAAHAASCMPWAQQSNAALLQAANCLRADKQAKKIERTSVRRALEHVQQSIVQLQQSEAAKDSAGAAKILAHDILALDALFAQRRGVAAQKQAQTLQQDSQALRHMLQSDTNIPDDALRDRVNALKRNIGQLLTQMAQVRPGQQDAPAAAHSEQKNPLQEAMRRLDEALASGDRAAAAAELAHVENLLAQAQGHVADAQQERADPRDEAMREQLQKLQTQATQLRDAQADLHKRIEAHTARVHAKAQAPLSAAERKSAALALQSALGHIEALHKQTPLAHSAAELLAGLQRHTKAAAALAKQQVLADALAQTQRAQQHAQSLAETLSLGHWRVWFGEDNAGLQQGARALGELGQDLQKAAALLQKKQQAQPSPADNAELHSLAQTQSSLSEQVRQAQAQMQQLSEAQPMLEEGGKPLQQALEQTQQALGALQDGSSDDARAPSEAAAAALQTFVDNLEEQRQQSEEAGGQPAPMGGAQPGQSEQGEGEGEGQGEGSEAGGGAPKPGQGKGAERGDASGPGEQKGGQQAGQQPQQAASRVGSGQGEQVDIPTDDARQNPAAFRQKVLQGAQSPPPPHYEDAVRHYYKELLRQ